MKKLLLIAICSIGVALATSVSIAQDAGISDGYVKIGVIGDMSGPYATLAGRGEVVAAQMAIKDFGGKVLGKPIKLVTADTQNKADVSVPIERRWIDNEDVDMITGITNSAIGLASQHIATQKHTIFIYTGASSTEMTNKGCSKYGIQYTYNANALSTGTAIPIVQNGNKKWYFIAVDYAYGHSMVKNATRVIEKMGGAVLGATYHPLSTTDFSSYLLRAQNSGADVIGIANSGSNFVDTVKQAHEFGITSNGTVLAGLLTNIMDMKALGLDTAQDLLFTTAFVWNRNDKTRKWSKRFFAQMNAMPTMQQAATYSAVTNYLKTIKITGTDNADAVRTQLGKMTINGVVIQNGHIRADGSAPHDMFLVKAKPPDQSKGPWDLLKVITTVSADKAYQPLSKSTCRLLDQ
jgi:branched-chain amino acid transport system substrate-binding protein